jgi:pSer/pThr/pTyr-binding forkhead associated (FHA) protein
VEAPPESSQRAAWRLPVTLVLIALAVAGLAALVDWSRRASRVPGDSPASAPVRSSPPSAAEPGEPPLISTGPVFGRLSVEKGLLLEQGQEFELRGTGARLGRGRNNHVVLPESSIAREHAEVRALADGTFWISDLGTSSGTFVNGVEVEREGAALADGDTIQLGTRVILRFSAA